MNLLPTFETYCKKTSPQNALVLTFPRGHRAAQRVRIWYSYRTPVAFSVEGGPIVVRENDWKQTTGRHLSAIDGGDTATRIPGEQFERRLAEIIVGTA